MSDREEHRPEHVAVFQTNGSEKFHRLDPDSEEPRPACNPPFQKRSSKRWTQWSLEKAICWREPCQCEACFGEYKPRTEQWRPMNPLRSESETEVSSDD